ncbi:CDP-alcohol phosphatidyltransferase family protein [Lacinutrix sp. C3R15]|uniref:CDP-alcohol phosphatidyltransferase family protein n=1 Tax=Flavobacteriaceae TaxID=49546 RepID=UPI001C088384|nr:MULTISPECIES: CDP-alcohol phosphatidyltransferase family protein [Flavobacteriaceae]MBU2939598.1 CDP-alcohol phosphatidyltransferase family protein [Lacinutrix sp. C3R15]MDO6622912.1 CDP-alcohol phosphatidyltransferase family protein [Oceanihabitans sp. 1_MG-2023]
MQLKSYIPNFITLLNLFCGSIAVVLAVNNLFVASALFVFLGIFFDFFDGFFARKLNVQSALGIQLDSLADMVTSGLVPGIIMYKLLALASDSSGIEISSWSSFLARDSFKVVPLALVGLCITLASAYRLAKFNLDEDQQSYFKGLPTPANTLLIISLPLILEYQNSDAMNAIILNTWVLLAITIVSCYMLNSSVKLFALKFKTYGFKGNAIRYTFILLSLVFLIVFQFAAIPLIILTYIILSLVSK